MAKSGFIVFVALSLVLLSECRSITTGDGKENDFLKALESVSEGERTGDGGGTRRAERDEITGPRRGRDEITGHRRDIDKIITGPRRGRDEITTGPRRGRDEMIGIATGPRRGRDEITGPRRGRDEITGPRRGRDEITGPRRGRDEILTGPRRGREFELGPRRGRRGLHSTRQERSFEFYSPKPRLGREFNSNVYNTDDDGALDLISYYDFTDVDD